MRELLMVGHVGFMAQLIAVLVLNHVGFCVSYVVA